MARKPHIQYRNLQQVLNADPALVTADIDTLSGITSSAAELNYLDTSAVGTVTASKAMTVDANSQVSGWRRKVVSADAVGEYVHIACVKAGQWETLDYRGTWTVEG